MIYEVKFSTEAEEDLVNLKKHEPKAFYKCLSLLEELKAHPMTGTGKPHQLKGDRAGQWSRSITKKHRLVYEIFEECVVVYVLAALGHYDDK